MAGLPSTWPGVPAPGVDPTIDEINTFGTPQLAVDWLGASAHFATALAVAIGAASIAEVQLRDIVFIPEAQWLGISGDMRVFAPPLAAAVAAAAAIADAGPGPGAQGPVAVERACTRLELGWLMSLRRIARLRLGLTAQDATAIPPLPVSQMADVPPGALALFPAPSLSSEPRLKLSMVIDPSLDSELVRLPGHVIRGLYADYKAKRVADPHERVEPTIGQISAVKQLLDADLVP